VQWRQTLANRTLALHLPGGRKLFVMTGCALWTQQRSSGVHYERRKKVYLTPLLKGNWNWVIATEIKKTRLMRLPGRERRFTITSAIWTQYANVTDGQTDGHPDGQRPTAYTALTHSVSR